MYDLIIVWKRNRDSKMASNWQSHGFYYTPDPFLGGDKTWKFSGVTPSKAGCFAKQAPYLLTIALPPNPCKYYSNETGDITQRQSTFLAWGLNLHKNNDDDNEEKKCDVDDKIQVQ